MSVSLIHVHDHICRSDWPLDVWRVASQLIWNIIAQVEPMKNLPAYMTMKG